MVKVKAGGDKAYFKNNTSFNHPMVKVKAMSQMLHQHPQHSFNHPMVKVKVVLMHEIGHTKWFQPPYGES